jgi:hypothetical protein
VQSAIISFVGWNWSGRRESNPRMQLGKQGACQSLQRLSSKTGINRAQNDQRLTSKRQNSQSPDLITYGRYEFGSIGPHDGAADVICKSPLFAEAIVVLSEDGISCEAGAPA